MADGNPLSASHKPVGWPGRGTLRHGLIILAIGIVIYGGLLAWLLPRKDILIDMPISLAPGHFVSQPFTPNVASHYILQIEYRRAFSQSKMNCLLGLSGADAGGYPDGCGSNRMLVNASWKLLSDNKTVVATGQSRPDEGGGWAKDTIDQQIGDFPLADGKSYTLSVDITSDGSRLNIAKPRLQLEISPLDYKGEFAIAQLVGPFGLLFLVVGLIMTSIGGVRYFMWCKS